MQWKKLESWRVAQLSTDQFIVVNLGQDSVYREISMGGTPTTFEQFAAALRAANKQNRLEGLPEVQ